MADDPDARDLVARMRESTIVLDREGRFSHDGVPVTHPGVSRALHRWISRDEDGRYVLRCGPVWCWFRVEDVPFLVRSVREEGARLVAALDDETEEVLEPGTLHLGEDGILRCRVKGGRFPARFDRHAHFTIADRLVEEAGILVLRVGATRWPVPRASSTLAPR